MVGGPRPAHGSTPGRGDGRGHARRSRASRRSRGRDGGARLRGPSPGLLVLDNAEHVADTVAELVVALREAAPGIHVLVTSQVPLGIPGERRVPLRPLGADAVELFVDRARANEPAFQVTTAERDRVAELCRRLDGLPLAIELAAAWIPTLSIEELLARLGERFELLVGGTSLELARHRTLRATVAWSRDRLLPVDAVRLDRFGVFPGTFDLDGAEAVARPDRTGGSGASDGTADRPVVATLRELVSASLLQVETLEAGTRYRLLETVRHFALEQLGVRGELPAVAARHARPTRYRLEAIAPRLQGPTLAATMRELAGIEDDSGSGCAGRGSPKPAPTRPDRRRPPARRRTGPVLVHRRPAARGPRVDRAVRRRGGRVVGPRGGASSGHRPVQRRDARCRSRTVRVGRRVGR